MLHQHHLPGTFEILMWVVAGFQYSAVFSMFVCVS